MDNKYDIESMKVKDIKEIIHNLPVSEYDVFMKVLENDSRKSVRNLGLKLGREKEKLLKEMQRLDKINTYEEMMYGKGAVYVGGVDEVGRGPLAGPVVAAVVILPRNTKIMGINDSKKLSESKREELFELIKLQAIDYAIGMADNNEIDEHNILQATYLAMRRAIDALSVKPDWILNDAVRIPGVDIMQYPIIKGDSKSISIAAASILAKVTRDRMMKDYEIQYPGYGFESNKGYGTSEHYQGIKEHGITQIHRLSFLKKFIEEEAITVDR